MSGPAGWSCNQEEFQLGPDHLLLWLFVDIQFEFLVEGLKKVKTSLEFL